MLKFSQNRLDSLLPLLEQGAQIIPNSDRGAAITGQPLPDAARRRKAQGAGQICLPLIAKQGLAYFSQFCDPVFALLLHFIKWCLLLR